MKHFLKFIMIGLFSTVMLTACETMQDIGDETEDAAEEVGDEMEDAVD